jgi:RNA polymerase sigma-70 factor (ECF subfamily)
MTMAVPWAAAEAPQRQGLGMDSEAALITQARAGNREAFDRLVGAHYDRLFRLAYTMTRSHEDARDLTQETFLAAVKSLPNFRGDAKLSTWLISCMRNQFTMWLRTKRKWKHQPIEHADDRPQPPPEEPIEPAVKAILDRLTDLPEDLRTALVLFYVDGLKYAEIAEAMECPIGTVRSRLFEARERLKKLMVVPT